LKRTEKLKITSAQAGKQKLSKLKFHWLSTMKRS